MIKCRALAEGSLYITSSGIVLPCCMIYRGGPDLTPELREIIKGENFSKLVDSWSSDKPYHTCYETCDDANTESPFNIIHFDKQWKKE